MTSSEPLIYSPCEAFSPVDSCEAFSPVDSCEAFSPLSPCEAVSPPRDSFSLYDYLGQGFFQQRADSLLCTTEVHGSSYGVAGDPMPYTLRGDNIVTIMLLGCFILGFISIARSLPFIRRQLKNFFYITHNEDDMFNETSNEMRFQLLLVFIDCLLLGIASFQLATEADSSLFTLHPSAAVANSSLFTLHSSLDAVVLLPPLSALFLAYILCKWTIQSMVNTVFFGSKKNIQWMKVQIFITACFTIFIYPIVLLQVYFDLSLEKTIYLFGFMLFLNKILTFYKCWLIFFRQNGSFFQIILYFCALEITPLLALGGIWLMMTDLLKVNF